MSPERHPPDHRFGFAACLGRTNVGKSTLANRILGQKIGIVSRKPQTTRRRVRGILNTKRAQIVIIDTPGLHGAKRAVDVSLAKEAREGVEGADLVVAITDHLGRRREGEESAMLDIVRRGGKPAILALNKCDLMKPRIAEELTAHYRNTGIFSAVLPVSAKRGDHVPELVKAMEEALPAGPAHYPREMISDQPERDFFAEIIREKIFRNLHQELPYSAAVVVDEVREEAAGKLYRIRATIYVERESQKGMLIGDGGRVLRAVGASARRDMERLTGEKVFLALWVKVRKNWSRDPAALREFGFGPG